MNVTLRSSALKLAVLFNSFGDMISNWLVRAIVLPMSIHKMVMCVLEIGPELSMVFPLDNPFDSLQCSWISWCPIALGFWVALYKFRDYDWNDCTSEELCGNQKVWCSRLEEAHKRKCFHPFDMDGMLTRAVKLSNPRWVSTWMMTIVRCGASVLGSVPCNRNVAGSNPTLAAT